MRRREGVQPGYRLAPDVRSGGSGPRAAARWRRREMAMERSRRAGPHPSTGGSGARRIAAARNPQRAAHGGERFPFTGSRGAGAGAGDGAQTRRQFAPPHGIGNAAPCAQRQCDLPTHAGGAPTLGRALCRLARSVARRRFRRDVPLPAFRARSPPPRDGATGRRTPPHQFATSRRTAPRGRGHAAVHSRGAYRVAWRAAGGATLRARCGPTPAGKRRRCGSNRDGS